MSKDSQLGEKPNHPEIAQTGDSYLKANMTIQALLEAVFWAVLWTLLIFSTVQAAYYNVKFLFRSDATQRQMNASTAYEWVASLCWAIVIVFWRH